MGGTAWTVCVRYLMFFFNLVFALTGLAILAIGAFFAFVVSNQSSSKFLEDSIFMYIPFILIAIGGIIAVIAFFGCCGAAKENHCMLFSFAGLLVVLFIVEVSALAVGYYFRDEVGQVMEDHFASAVKEYHADTDAQKYMDDLQTQFQCCGVHGPTDYGIQPLPFSCCNHHDPNQECPAPTAYARGCYDAIQADIGDIVVIVCAVIGTIAGVQFIGIMFAYCLARSIKRGYEIV